MVGELPDGVGPGSPEHHLPEGVVLGGGGVGGYDFVDGRVAGCLEGGGNEVDEAVEGYAGHDVDEEAD